MEISWGELNQSKVDFIVLSLQQTTFAVVTGQIKFIVPWLHLQVF